MAERPVAGKGDPRNAEVIIASIRKAATMAQDGTAAAIVTNPINKAILKDAGFSHPGHTEFLASLAPARPGAPLMMLAENRSVSCRRPCISRFAMFRRR